MAQADTASTTSRDPGVRPVAAFPATLSTDLKQAHSELIARLLLTRPHHIRFVADHADIIERAEHVDAVLNAVHAYVSEVVADTASSVELGAIDRKSLGGVLKDARSEVAGAIAFAAEQMNGGGA